MSSKNEEENNIAKNINDFCNFLYDGRRKTIMGRSKSSWGDLLINFLF